MKRRDFLKMVGGVFGGMLLDSSLSSSLWAGQGAMPMRPLGATGLRVSLLGLGGFNVGLESFTDETSVDFIRYAIDQGVTFLDNAREYNNNRSEERVGKALKNGYRKKVVLMTKNCAHERDYANTMRSIDESLKAFQTDVIDVMLFHEVNYPDDPKWIFERGGIEAMIEARKQGKIRFIGFSGHKLPTLHLEMLNRPFKWDVVMLPLGIMDYHYHSFTRHVLPTLVRRGIGIIGFKTLGGFMSGLLEKAHLTVEESLRYSMSLPASTIVVGMEQMNHLKQNIATARNFKPMSKFEMENLRQRTAQYGKDGLLEIYKSTRKYDGAPGKKANNIQE